MRHHTTSKTLRHGRVGNCCVRSCASRRRASVYVLVLGSAMVVMVIGLAALASVGIERRTSQSSAEFTRARMYARSAIEMGYYWMRKDPNWRTTLRRPTVWATDIPIGDGTFSLEVNDPDDGDIGQAPNNFVVMTGTGVCNTAKYIVEVTLSVSGGKLTVVDGSWKRIVY